MSSGPSTGGTHTGPSDSAGSMPEPTELEIRSRVRGDLDALVAVARRVRDRDRYPVYEPSEGLARFYSDPSVLGAWVATIDDRLVGHVALQPRGTVKATAIAAAHTPPESLAFVSRLMVDPDIRGARVGARLLEHARQVALAWGRAPYLEALDIPEGAAALALYRAEGWVELDRVVFDLTDDGFDDVVFAGSTRSPAADQPRPR